MALKFTPRVHVLSCGRFSGFRAFNIPFVLSSSGSRDSQDLTRYWMARHLRFSFVKIKYYIEIYRRVLHAVVLTSGLRCSTSTFTSPDTVVVGLYDWQNWTQIVFLEGREQDITFVKMLLQSIYRVCQPLGSSQPTTRPLQTIIRNANANDNNYNDART